jgi:hypothetical protein
MNADETPASSDWLILVAVVLQVRQLSDCSDSADGVFSRSLAALQRNWCKTRVVLIDFD